MVEQLNALVEQVELCKLKPSAIEGERPFAPNIHCQTNSIRIRYKTRLEPSAYQEKVWCLEKRWLNSSGIRIGGLMIRMTDPREPPILEDVATALFRTQGSSARHKQTRRMLTMSSTGWRVRARPTFRQWPASAHRKRRRVSHTVRQSFCSPLPNLKKCHNGVFATMSSKPVRSQLNKCRDDAKCVTVGAQLFVFISFSEPRPRPRHRKTSITSI
jgi:hypothetical protein